MPDESITISKRRDGGSSESNEGVKEKNEVHKIQAGLVQAGIEAMIYALTWVCKKQNKRKNKKHLEDKRMAYHMDSIPSYYTPKER